MSTPSTATVTVPPVAHQYYQYRPAMNQNYPQPARAPLPNGYSNPPPASADARYHQHSQQHHHQQYPSHHSPLEHSQSVAASDPPPSARKRSRNEPVDWETFFGGRPPKEIIVIDDDDEGGAEAGAVTQSRSYHSRPQHEPQHQHQHEQQYPLDSALSQQYHTSAVPGAPLHVDKRRRIAGSTHYDPVHNAASGRENGGYSTQATAPQYHDETPSYAADGATGQKRKRVTRQGAAVEQKRRDELNWLPDPFSAYVPPPKPPNKAKEVFVPVIQDRSATRHQKVDDDDGHYIVKDGAELTERYSIKRLLGQGTFGKVVQAYDRKRQCDVAIKIIRSVQKYRDASRIEVRVLSTLASNDRTNRNKCIHLRDTFDWKNHICIVTDLLGQSVFDFLKNNSFVPFPSSQIQHFARQLLTSVAFLHDLNLIHTDLKPENILLVNNAYQTFTYNRNIPSSSATPARTAKYRKVLLEPEIRLIDFGSATFDDEYHSSVVSTRHYRAPEIILNLGWSFPCDIWSIGCILVEFFTGDALFQTHDNLEHLAMMEPVCNGPLDKALIRQVTSGRGSNKNSAAAYFKRQVLDYPQPETPRSSRKFVKAMKSLHETIPPVNDFNKKFLDLLRRIFVYDAKKRITAHEALQHPWFRERFEDDGTEAEKIRDKLAAAALRGSAGPAASASSASSAALR